jgi:Tol biopolymer transport system component
MRRVATLALFSCVLTGTTSVAAAVRNEGGGASSGNGLIAFVRTGAIYVMNADGTGVHRLMHEAREERNPDWSPDGQKIIFESARRNQEGGLTVANADGSGLHALRDLPLSERDPAWSPDGRRIAFDHELDLIGQVDVYVMNANGTQPRRLTRTPGGDSDPDWSPDGTKIVFQSQRDNLRIPPSNERYLDNEIYVINADGSGLRRLTRNSANDLYPAWSPDGKTIAFASGRDSGDRDFELYVMDADGSHQRRLTRSRRNEERRSAWSPDGRKILFESGAEIYVMNANGTGIRRLTHKSGEAPTWRPAP